MCNTYCFSTATIVVRTRLCVALGRAYIGARTDTTQQSGQTSDKEVKINHITGHVSGYTEIDSTGMLPANNSRLSGPTK